MKETVDWWSRDAQNLRDALKSQPIVKKAKNVILVIGDGMGPSTVTAARIYQAQVKGQTLPDAHLAWEKFPYMGLSKVS